MTQHTDPGALLGRAQSPGQFTIRHALTLGFTVLLLAFFYQQGESPACELTGVLRQAIGDRVEPYVALQLALQGTPATGGATRPG